MAQTVLIVDDEPLVFDSLRRTLRNEPYALRYAPSGQQALEILAAEPIDAVIADEVMPGMNGTELLKLIRDTYPRTLRIMLTGNATVETAMAAIRDGWVFQFLHKPCAPADMAACLHYGLLQQSLIMEGEDPHLKMSKDQQEELLQSFRA
jgi:DNA-binding NtrC family response regulator